MADTATFERNRTHAAELQPGQPRVKDDAAMLKAAARLTRDLNLPNDRIYWADMLGSALLGYAGLFGAMLLRPAWLAILSGAVAVLALYRAGSFIHELTHVKKGAVKGFRFAWNLIVGVPRERFPAPEPDRLTTIARRRQVLGGYAPALGLGDAALELPHAFLGAGHLDAA